MNTLASSRNNAARFPARRKIHWNWRVFSAMGSPSLTGQITAPVGLDVVTTINAQSHRPSPRSPGRRRRHQTSNVPEITQPHPPTGLRLAEEEIDGPAAADVRPRPAAVGEDVGVGAAGVLQRVRQDRQPLEGPLLVD